MPSLMRSYQFKASDYHEREHLSLPTMTAGRSAIFKINLMEVLYQLVITYIRRLEVAFDVKSVYLRVSSISKTDRLWSRIKMGQIYLRAQLPIIRCMYEIYNAIYHLSTYGEA